MLHTIYEYGKCLKDKKKEKKRKEALKGRIHEPLLRLSFWRNIWLMAMDPCLKVTPPYIRHQSVVTFAE